NSLTFLIFFIGVYVVYRVLPFRWQNWLLICAGYVFYGCWDIRFLFLIACSTVVDFSIGLLLAKGYIPAPQRITASLFLICSAFLFLCPNWSMLTTEGLTIFFKPQPTGLKILFGTVVFVFVANVLISHF